MYGRDRVGRFFLKRRGVRGTFRICWYDAAMRQTRSLSTRTRDLDQARAQMLRHAANAEHVRKRATILDGCELPDVASADGALIEAHEVVSIAAGRCGGAGVYFLIRGAQIVYVGQSLRARSRVQEHAREGAIAFDRYLIMPCGKTDLRALEARYVAKFEPALNKRVPMRVTSFSDVKNEGVSA